MIIGVVRVRVVWWCAVGCWRVGQVSTTLVNLKPAGRRIRQSLPEALDAPLPPHLLEEHVFERNDDALQQTKPMRAQSQCTGWCAGEVEGGVAALATPLITSNRHDAARPKLPDKLPTWKLPSVSSRVMCRM